MIKIELILLPFSILKETIKIFKKFGKKNLEAIAIWVGQEEKTTFKIKEVWIPTQFNTNISYYVPDINVHNINAELNKKNYSAIAQLHTHPGDAFHSCIDDNNSILTLPGSFSIVVPEFGRILIRDNLNNLAIYRLLDKGWVLQSINKVNKLFKIIK